MGNPVIKIYARTWNDRTTGLGAELCIPGATCLTDAPVSRIENQLYETNIHFIDESPE